MWDYEVELRKTNLGTTVQIKCDYNEVLQQTVFQRMYIYMGALKKGFKAGCMPLIGLDGCHLKNPYEGQLLSAIGLDVNNMTWVIAYAQVEVENKES
ncbi:unnamed protein product [Prunus armeniaca]